MIEFDVYLAISALSGLVIVSYIFSLISKRTRIPTVLMLLALGVGIREIAEQTGNYYEMPLDFVQFFGVLGLILVLLDAGLDLNLSRNKLPLVKRAIGSAAFILTLSGVSIAAILRFVVEMPWYESFVYAASLAVISSTIVASSISYLSEDKREFLTYESAVSDIIGILMFNLLIAGESVSVGMIAVNIGSFALAIVSSVGISILLVFLLARVKIEIKAFLIFGVLMLIYAVGHLMNLPSLLTVLIFGLIINNWGKSKIPAFHTFLSVQAVSEATKTVKNVTTESAFLIRTIFFTLFGYMIDVRSLADTRVLIIGSAIVAAIFVARYLYLRLFLREHVLPEIFFAPRGLVTVVLFYSIPASLAVDNFDDSIIFFVVAATTIIMMIGSIWFTPHHATRDAEENGTPPPVKKSAVKKAAKAEQKLQAKNGEKELKPDPS